jgi:hypothetical protein
MKKGCENLILVEMQPGLAEFASQSTATSHISIRTDDSVSEAMRLIPLSLI